MKHYTKILFLIVLIGLGILVQSTQAAPLAGTIAVNTTTDEFGAGANCSLREAIQSANTDTDYGGCTRVGTPVYTINVPAGTYLLNIGSSNEDSNADGDLDILVSMDISGAGADSTIIDGSATERVFEIRGATVTISGVTITNGNANATSTNGGGIHNTGTVTLNNCAISNNTAQLDGGGIYNAAGTATLNNSTVSGNSTLNNGGNGGGISNFESLLTLNNSTVSGNSAATHGGGIINYGFLSPSTLNLNHSTIANNIADSDTGGDGGDGGGIFNIQMMGTVTVNFTSSIVAGNSDATAGDDADDCVIMGPFTSNGYNVFGKNGDAEGCQTIGTDIVLAGLVGTLLYTLEDNGGPTLTHGLTPGGPAIDIIDSGTNGCGASPFDVDQRGLTRPIDVAGVGGGVPAKCDAGAYEAQDGSTPTAVSLQSITATSNTAILPALIATLLLALVGGVVLRRRA